MSLDHGYGVLKCRAIAREMERDDRKSPHFQVLAADGQHQYRLAINVKSVQLPFDLLYRVDDAFDHQIINQLLPLNLGFHAIPKSEQKASGMALDYIRSNLLQPTEMKPLPADAPGLEDDLHDVLELYIQRSLGNASVDLYVFGEPWGPEESADKIFDFKPGRGIHNIHMNQGSQAPYSRENGVYQDGGLLMHFRDRQQWVAAFFAFQSQSFHTNDQTGDPIDVRTGTEPIPVISSPIRIVASLVNPPGADPGKETVTLFNATSTRIDLKGWTIADRLKRKSALTGYIEPDSALQVKLSGTDIQLGNNGGILTLLDPQGTKVDGVSYTKKDAQESGRTIIFTR